MNIGRVISILILLIVPPAGASRNFGEATASRRDVFPGTRDSTLHVEICVIVCIFIRYMPHNIQP